MFASWLKPFASFRIWFWCSLMVEVERGLREGDDDVRALQTAELAVAPIIRRFGIGRLFAFRFVALHVYWLVSVKAMDRHRQSNEVSSLFTPW